MPYEAHRLRAQRALPHIAGSLAASSDQATWVLTSYLVANAVVLPMTGWLGAKFGRKRFLLVCITLFTPASALCGAADTLLPLPPYCPELNPVEGFGRLLKAPTANRLYSNLRKLEDHIIAVARSWTSPEKVHSLIHGWMRDQANAGVPS